MRRRLVHVIGVVAVAAAGVIYTLVAENEPLLGLDLQGGASVVLEPARAADAAELDVAVEIIRNRVDGLGVAEPEISTQGGNILVQLPGVDDQQRAIDLVGQTAELRFRPVIDVLSEDVYQAAVQVLAMETTASAESGDAGSGGSDETPEESDVGAGDEGPDDVDAAEIERILEQFELTSERTDVGSVPADAEVVLASYGEDRGVEFRYRLGPATVTGDALEDASSRYDPLYGWRVAATFKPGAEGIDQFNELSQRCFYLHGTCPTKQVAIEIDNEVISAASVQDDAAIFVPFDRSNVTITGDFTEQEAGDLALVLSYGVLPVELEAQQSRIVSASLGADALRAGVVSGLIGLGLVSLYLIAYYRLLGLVAIASLALSGSMLWVIIAWLGESQGLALTLAGVTGLIVAIGVSVDSNVVYFEHLKEDVRSGRTVRSATDRAFPIAFSTIVKADTASLIAAVVLYLLTVGQVRGFALYLGLATILDLVATYFFMGPLIGLITRSQGMQARSSRFGIPAPSAAAGARAS